MPLFSKFKLGKKTRNTTVSADSVAAPAAESSSKASPSHNAETSTTGNASKGSPGETVSSSSSSLSSNSGPKASTTELALPRPKDEHDHWAQTFDILEARESDLAGDFAKHLGSLQRRPGPPIAKISPVVGNAPPGRAR